MVVAVCNRMAADTTNTTITLHVAVSAATSTAALMECTSIETAALVSAPEVTVHLDSTRILNHASVNVAQYCGFDEVLDYYTCQCRKKRQYPDVQCSSLQYLYACLNSESLYEISCL